MFDPVPSRYRYDALTNWAMKALTLRSVGRVQFLAFEKFASAYLFQIAQEKSCDYFLITEGTHADHAIREKLRHELRHPGRALHLKTKDLICHLWVSLIIDQSDPVTLWYRCDVLTNWAMKASRRNSTIALITARTQLQLKISNPQCDIWFISYHFVH